MTDPQLALLVVCIGPFIIAATLLHWRNALAQSNHRHRR